MKHACVELFVCLLVSIMFVEGIQNDFVSITTKSLQKIYVPVAREPILTWMEIKLGVYPNNFPIVSKVQIGEVLTIFVYIKDVSKLYDMSVTNCVVLDAAEHPENVLFMSQSNSKKAGHLSDWVSGNLNATVSFQASTFTTFKFSDKENVFISCNVKICYNKCQA